MSTVKVALCQLMVNKNKNISVKKAVDMISAAAKGGASLAVLPEMFNCPYNTSYFREYAENVENSKTLEAVSNAAKKHNIYVVAGSIPELGENDELYNTSFIFDKEGKIIGRHRKMHLFDIDVPGK